MPAKKRAKQSINNFCVACERIERGKGKGQAHHASCPRSRKYKGAKDYGTLCCAVAITQAVLSPSPLQGRMQAKRAVMAGTITTAEGSGGRGIIVSIGVVQL